MSTPLAPFPDIPAVVMAGIEAYFAPELDPIDIDGQTAYRVAGAFAPEGPLLGEKFVRVSALGGPETLITTRPTVDIDVFAGSRREARDLSQRIHQWLVRYPHRVWYDARFVVLDTVRVSMSPQEVDWQDSRVRRFYSSYQISARR